MNTAALERPAAILYTGTTATWCRGGCGKFRYPYCYVADRPYCEGCAFIARLEPIAALPKLKSASEKPAQSKRGAKHLIPSLLEDGPASTKDLAAQLGLCSDSVNLAARKLVAEGVIIAQRQRGNGARMPMYYALPGNIEKLREVVGKSLPELILQELAYGAKTKNDLHKILLNKVTEREFHFNSLEKALSRLMHDGRITKHGNLRFYQLVDGM